MAKKLAKEYNGHKSRGHWNVSLWINNDEHLYRTCLNYFACGFTRREVARGIVELWKNQRTPDGYEYTFDRVFHALDWD